MGANYNYNCKCLNGLKEDSIVNLQEFPIDQNEIKEVPIAFQAPCDCYDDLKILTPKNKTASICQPKIAAPVFRRTKEKTKSELLRMPLEIINELRHEEVNNNNDGEACQTPDYNFKLEILKVNNTSFQKSEDRPNNHGKSKSLYETQTVQSLSKSKSKKPNAFHKKNNSNSNESWKNYSISMIIPQKKLNSCNPEELLMQGELYKYFFDEKSPKFGSKNYAQKFFIVNKIEFSYFKSKEAFLRQITPLARIPFFQIKTVQPLPISTTEYSLNKQYYHLIIELNTEPSRKSFMDNLEGLSRINRPGSKSNIPSNNISQTNIFTEMNDKSLNLPSLLKEFNNQTGRIKDKVKKPNKISLIKHSRDEASPKEKFISILESNEKNEFLDVQFNIPTSANKSRLFIFADKNPELINKLVFLLNYLKDKELH